MQPKSPGEIRARISHMEEREGDGIAEEIGRQEKGKAKPGRGREREEKDRSRKGKI